MIDRNTEAPMTQNPCYALVPSSVKHPATYTESFIPKFAELLFGCANVLDPLVSWANPADIKFGTPLSATQLNATPIS